MRPFHYITLFSVHQFWEGGNNLSPGELSAIQEERRHIREDGIKGVMQKLRNTFGKKYDYNIFKEVETEVSKALNEKQLPKKSIQAQLQRKQQKSMPYIPQKRKNHEFER